MTRRPGAARERIVEAAYRCFYREGFLRVSVDAIAAAAGVTKKTVYYHFESKDALLGAVLDEQKDLVLTLIEEGLATSGLEAPALVREVFTRLRRWAADRPWYGSGFTRIAMELADLPGHPARIAAKRHKASVEAAVAGYLEERGVAGAPDLAAQVVILLEGAMALTLIHGDRRYVDMAGAAAEKLIMRTSNRS